MKTAKGANGGKGKSKTRVRPRRLPGVPPPESEVWPEQYRGENWKAAFALLFAGRCQLCAYSCPLPQSRQMLDKWRGETRLLLCTNHPASPGALREVLPTDTCRNFQAKRWRPSRPTPARCDPAGPADESDPTIRRIPVGQGLFALVDAADYEWLSQYKWYAYRRGRRTYAVCQTRGKMVYMHRMILRPRKGYLVDHIDGNGLNNRRCNLRECTSAQNQANMRPCGVSGYIGVYPKGNKWRASISCRGKFYYLGLFDDPLEAARARDRKAYALHGPHAYLNRPQDLGRAERRRLRRQPQRRAKVGQG